MTIINEIPKQKILITSALPYVNNVPHLGNIIGAVLSADVFARFCRSYGHKTLYICGTDEHGTATETKALEEGVTPKEICDKYYAIHKDIYSWFRISFDEFGRTSTETQTELTQDIFKKLNDNGYIAEDKVDQLYCRSCDKFLADRFVEGKCPKCGFDDARGDQCDSCSSMLNAVDLIEPRCKICNSTPEIKTSEHLFIDLPKLKPALLEWIDRRSAEGRWSNNAKTMTYAWIKEGLKRRAITRDLKWGVPIPLEKYKEKVFYVWFDAPIGYLSITKKAFPEDYEKWWKDDWKSEAGIGTKLYQFMGKDNVPFHTIVFPSSLLGSGDDYTMLYTISSTEYLNYEDGKFSKSRGIGVFGTDAKDTGIDPDIFRYYLLINRPEKSDASFQWNDMQDKCNNELVANFGNLINRTAAFISRFFDGIVPYPELKDSDIGFIERIKIEEKKVTEKLHEIELKEALKSIMHISRLGNQYFQENEPWKVIKEDKVRAGTVMYVLANLASDLAVMIRPYMPDASDRIFAILGTDKQDWSSLGTLPVAKGQKISEPRILFSKLEDDFIKGLKVRYSGTQNERIEAKVVNKSEELSGIDAEDAFPLNLRVAEIVEAKPHPEADRLMILQLDLGDEKRQIVAGIRSFYSPEELLGRRIVVLTNLKPAKLRGEVSNGMLLAASREGDSNTCILIDAGDSDVGEFIHRQGQKNRTSKILYDDFSKIRLETKGGKVLADGIVLDTEAGAIKVSAEDGWIVK